MAESTEEPVMCGDLAVSENDINCSVCLDLLQDPRLLPCLHAYCLKCLEGIHRKSKEKEYIKCPQCRKDHPVPSGGVSEFIQDQILSTAAQAHALKSKGRITMPKPPRCSTCPEDDPATGYCSTCGKYLCDFCQKAHKRLYEFRGHQIRSIGEMDPKELITFEHQSFHCPVHSGELCNVFCKTCQKLICRNCTIVDHSKHEYGFTNLLRPQIEKETDEIVEQLKANKGKFEEHLAFLRGMEKQHCQYGLELEGEIQTKFESFIKTLTAHQDKLLDRVRSSKEANMKQIWAEKEYVETTLAGISGALRYIDRLSSCSSDQVMLAMRIEAAAQLSSLQSAEWSGKTLTLSSPQKLITADPQLEQCGTLKDITLNDVVKNVASNAAYELGEKVTVTVELKHPTVSCEMIPSVKVNKECCKIYPPQLTGEGKWMIDIFPRHSGYFTASVMSVSAQYGGEPLEQLANNTGGSSVSCQFNVSGKPKPGDRVQRGPDWHGNNEDGGRHSLGTVVARTGTQRVLQSGQKAQQTNQNYHGRGGPDQVYVRWNHCIGYIYEYRWGYYSYPIQLAG